MKCGAKSPLRRLRNWLLGVGCGLLPLFAGAVTTGLNPYSGIVERNSFGLKPPVNPADLIKPPPPQTTDIKLQGITTILGRKQVLMKLRLPARPPEPAREQSVVLSEGQGIEEIEVLEINPVDGTVKVKNAGITLALNMKDHGEKPAPGAAAPALGSPTPGGLPGIPPPAFPAVSGVAAPVANPVVGSAGAGMAIIGGGAGQSISGFGSTATSPVNSGNAAQKTIPTRALRTSNAATTATGNEFQNISPEAQAILIEAQRTQISPGGFDPLPKTAITPRQ